MQCSFGFVAPVQSRQFTLPLFILRCQREHSQQFRILGYQREQVQQFSIVTCQRNQLVWAEAMASTQVVSQVFSHVTTVVPCCFLPLPHKHFQSLDFGSHEIVRIMLAGLKANASHNDGGGPAAQVRLVLILAFGCATQMREPADIVGQCPLGGLC